MHAGDEDTRMEKTDTKPEDFVPALRIEQQLQSRHIVAFGHGRDFPEGDTAAA